MPPRARTVVEVLYLIAAAGFLLRLLDYYVIGEGGPSLLAVFMVPWAFALFALDGLRTGGLYPRFGWQANALIAAIYAGACAAVGWYLFDEFEAIGRNPFYKVQPDGSLRHETEVIVDRGIDFIRRHPKGKPFALNMWFNACHAEDGDRRPGIGHFPWPRAVDGMYETDEIAPPRLNDPAIFESQPDFLKTTINRERFFWRWNTDLKYRTNMRAYLRMVSGIDNAIG